MQHDRAPPPLTDDLPLGNFVGASESAGGSKRNYYLYNIFDFSIEYNDNNVRSLTYAH